MLKKTEQEGPADSRLGQSLAPGPLSSRDSGSLLLPAWLPSSELGPGSPSPPQPHGAGTSEPGATHICRSAGRTALLCGETSVIHSLLARGTPPPTWGTSEEASWRALGNALSTQLGLQKQASFIPGTPLQTSLTPIHLWMVTGNPFLEEQTMLGSRQEPIPMSRIF